MQRRLLANADQFGIFALGNIGVDTHYQRGLAVGLPLHHLAAGENPLVAAIVNFEPVFVFIHGRFALDVADDIAVAGAFIRWMHPAHPLIQIERIGRFRPQTAELAPLGGKAGAVVDYVPLPKARVAGAQRQCQALTRLFGLLVLRLQLLGVGGNDLAQVTALQADKTNHQQQRAQQCRRPLGHYLPHTGLISRVFAGNFMPYQHRHGRVFAQDVGLAQCNPGGEVHLVIAVQQVPLAINRYLAAIPPVVQLGIVGTFQPPVVHRRRVGFVQALPGAIPQQLFNRIFLQEAGHLDAAGAIVGGRQRCHTHFHHGNHLAALIAVGHDGNGSTRAAATAGNFGAPHRQAGAERLDDKRAHRTDAVAGALGQMHTQKTDGAWRHIDGQSLHAQIAHALPVIIQLLTQANLRGAGLWRRHTPLSGDKLLLGVTQ